jgi:hypothetical protein
LGTFDTTPEQCEVSDGNNNNGSFRSAADAEVLLQRKGADIYRLNIISGIRTWHSNTVLWSARYGYNAPMSFIMRCFVFSISGYFYIDTEGTFCEEKIQSTAKA